jgi:hypothetical protein
VEWTKDSLSGDLPGTRGIQCPFKKPAFGIGDAHDQLALVVAMASAQGDRSFSVDQSGHVGRVHRGKGFDGSIGHGLTLYSEKEMIKKKPPACDRGLSAKLVEAAGQLFHSFRSGLDYSFIPVARDAGRIIQYSGS